eukprot:gene14523-61983_t
MSEGHFMYKGQLKGHGGWVTSIGAPLDNSEMVVSASRDRCCVTWELTPDSYDDSYGFAKRRMAGHSGFVEDIQISSDGQFGLSASWDTDLRLWGADNRQIVSGGRDQKLKVWNTLGECKYTISQDGHTDWVSCVRFSPNPQIPLIVSAGRGLFGGGKDGTAMLCWVFEVEVLFNHFNTDWQY